MSDYTEHGAIPVEDAAVDGPPTVEAVAANQRRDFPSQVVETGQVVADITENLENPIEDHHSPQVASAESARLACLDAAAAAQMISRSLAEVPDEDRPDLDATAADTSEVLVMLANALSRPDRTVRRATLRRMVEAGLEATTDFASICESLSDEGWLHEGTTTCETCAGQLRGLLRLYATDDADVPGSAIPHR